MNCANKKNEGLKMECFVDKIGVFVSKKLKNVNNDNRFLW